MKPDRRLLTIAIPTYKRLTQIQNTLNALFSDPLPSYAELLIIDNCSDYPIDDVIKPFTHLYPDQVSFLRNSGNVGSAANVMKCLENATGEWVWILSDDDPPLPDAIRLIYKAIHHSEENLALIKFSSSNGSAVDEETIHQHIHSFEQISKRCSDPKFYSNLLFISTSIYRVDIAHRYLNIGYQYTVSLAPHIFVLFEAMTHGHSILLCAEHIVKEGVSTDPNKTWQPIKLRMGLMSYLDVSQYHEFQHYALPAITKSYLGSNWLFGMMRDIAANDTQNTKFWMKYYLCMGISIGGLRGFVTILFSFLSLVIHLFRIPSFLKNMQSQKFPKLVVLIELNASN